jgi:hypothetical protein
MKMPISNPDLTNLTREEKDIINLVVKKNGQIRATKPKVKEETPITGKAAYVWREVVFMVSPKPTHMCMPVTADFDLPAYDENGKWSSQKAREMSKTLKATVDAIVDGVDKSQWHGVRRWGKAFGFQKL